MFPDRFRALVVDGVLDPTAWVGNTRQILDERLRSSDGAYRALIEILQRCDRAGEKFCVFAAGDPVRNFATIARELRAKPVELPDGDGWHVHRDVRDLRQRDPRLALRHRRRAGGHRDRRGGLGRAQHGSSRRADRAGSRRPRPPSGATTSRTRTASRRAARSSAPTAGIRRTPGPGRPPPPVATSRRRTSAGPGAGSTASARTRAGPCRTRTPIAGRSPGGPPPRC